VAAIGSDPPNHSGKTLLKKSIGGKTPIKTKIQELVLRLLYAGEYVVGHHKPSPRCG
jgi:hypothetical protein